MSMGLTSETQMLTLQHFSLVMVRGIMSRWGLGEESSCLFLLVCFTFFYVVDLNVL